MRSGCIAPRDVRRWRWAGAISIGSSHIESGQPCQDAASVCEYKNGEDTIFVAIVADGLGSATHSEIGSRIVASRAQKCVRDFLSSGGSVEDLDGSVILSWINSVRDSLSDRSKLMNIEMRDLASTMTMVVAFKNSSCVVQVGDSLCVFKCGEDFLVPIWPKYGEYANVVYPITRLPEPVFDFAIFPKVISGIAVFSDGLEGQLVNRREKSAYAPFFQGVFQILERSLTDGRDRLISNEIRDYLNSEKICSQTDDDKTLILALRH